MLIKTPHAAPNPSKISEHSVPLEMATARETRRWMIAAACVIACCVALIPACDAASNRCTKKMSSRNLKVGEEFRETRVSLNCEKGEIRWLSAKKRHVLTFFKGHKDLTVCLSVIRPGARVYRLRGSQRQLIAGVNDTGFLGCYKSECKHVSFMFEVDEDYSGPKNLVYEYSGYIDIKCAECTEVCQRDCLCKSDFAFHGKLTRSVFRTNTYLYYFQVAEFVKYNGQYQEQLLEEEIEKCPVEVSNSNSTVNDTEDLSLLEMITAEIPRSGTVRVIAKCPLRLRKTYFVSATTHITRNGRPRLIMCCQHSDEHYAVAHLADLVHRQECCRHT